MDVCDEPNIYLREETEEEYNTDDCTSFDNIITKAYNKAVYKAEKQIVQNLGKKFNSGEEDAKHFLGDSLNPAVCPTHEKKKEKYKSLPIMWKVGDRCRCIYSEDGEVYEAEIISITGNTDCRVKYIGYGNEENVLLQDLAPSLPAKRIRSLKKMAVKCNPSSSDEEGEIHSEPEIKEESLPEMEHERYDSTTFRIPRRTQGLNINMMPSPPIPPPDPFSSLDNDTFLTEEVFNSMLMSWYICGYYTGYYAAQQKYTEKNPADQ